MNHLRTIFVRRLVGVLGLLFAAAIPLQVRAQSLAPPPPPSPLLHAGTPVDWFFAFKTNTATAPSTYDAKRTCAFGGTSKPYPHGFSLTYGIASSTEPVFTPASGDIGAGDQDPLGATFDEVYNGRLNYVVWNDQFYDDPRIAECKKMCAAPWAHSKGLLAWDDNGDGLVIQVSTPSWPAAGGSDHPRNSDGNTLGCIDDDNVLVSQHFFAVKLGKDGVLEMLQALANSSVVTDPSNPQIVRNGGPTDIQAAVSQLGQLSASTSVLIVDLTPTVRLISKPHTVKAPPWQLVSAELGGVPLRVATWWERNKIPDTQADTPMNCLDEGQFGQPGAVTIAKTGSWEGKPIGLLGGASKDKNHAKIGVSTDPSHPIVIFGDMNQEGALSDNCDVSQNPRGGLFYVVENADLANSVTTLISPPPP